MQLRNVCPAKFHSTESRQRDWNPQTSKWRDRYGFSFIQQNPGNGIETIQIQSLKSQMWWFHSTESRQRDWNFHAGIVAGISTRFHSTESRQRDWNTPDGEWKRLTGRGFIQQNPGNGIETQTSRGQSLPWRTVSFNRIPATGLKHHTAKGADNQTYVFHSTESRQRDWNSKALQELKRRDAVSFNRIPATGLKQH